MKKKLVLSMLLSVCAALHGAAADERAGEGEGLVVSETESFGNCQDEANVACAQLIGAGLGGVRIALSVARDVKDPLARLSRLSSPAHIAQGRVDPIRALMHGVEANQAELTTLAAEFTSLNDEYSSGEITMLQRLLAQWAYVAVRTVEKKRNPRATTSPARVFAQESGVQDVPSDAVIAMLLEKIPAPVLSAVMPQLESEMSRMEAVLLMSANPALVAKVKAAQEAAQREEETARRLARERANDCCLL